MGLMEEIIRVYNEPDPHPYLYAKGQWVRILNGVVEDGQTPKEWAGCLCIVEHRRTTGLHKDHIYFVVDPRTRKRSEFKEEELDRRFILKRSPERTTERKSPQTVAIEPTPTASNATENAGGGDNSTGTKGRSIVKTESTPVDGDSHTPNARNELSAKEGRKPEGPERVLDSKSRLSPSPALPQQEQQS